LERKHPEGQVEGRNIWKIWEFQFSVPRKRRIDGILDHLEGPKQLPCCILFQGVVLPGRS
jgi:hypothetical protein